MQPVENRWVTLVVKHNIEVAHRLFTLPGKCQNIHGHSMYVTMEVMTRVDDNGYALNTDGTILEFAALKKAFRAYLDGVWDHHLHLNEKDPWAENLGTVHNKQGRAIRYEKLPGLVIWPADPSTENIAYWIQQYIKSNILVGMMPIIRIDETGTNGVIV